MLNMLSKYECGHLFKATGDQACQFVAVAASVVVSAYKSFNLNESDRGTGFVRSPCWILSTTLSPGDAYQALMSEKEELSRTYSHV